MVPELPQFLVSVRRLSVPEFVRIRLKSTGIPGQVRVVDAAVAHHGNGASHNGSGGPPVMGTSVWEHLGPILTELQMLDATGWSAEILDAAVDQRQVLRLCAADGVVGYWSHGLIGLRPHIPLAGIDDALLAQSFADVDPWTIASWLSTEQIELNGRTPRTALLSGHSASTLRTLSISPLTRLRPKIRHDRVIRWKLPSWWNSVKEPSR